MQSIDLQKHALDGSVGYGGIGWSSGPNQWPTEIRDWLTLSGSLTAGVRGVSTEFRVRRELEAWRRPWRDEAGLLGVSERERVWTREVTLRDGDVPLVYAHTIAARSALPAWPWLRGLGDRPLGEVLFEHQGVSRRPLAFRRLDARHPLFQRAQSLVFEKGCGEPESLYARRSVFVLQQRPLLVTELFFPELFARKRVK